MSFALKGQTILAKHNRLTFRVNRGNAGKNSGHRDTSVSLYRRRMYDKKKLLYIMLLIFKRNSNNGV